MNKIKYLTQEEVRSLLSVIKDKRDKAIFLLAYRHGLRASEVGMIKVVDVNFSVSKIFISRLKDSESSEHPMCTDELHAIKQYLKKRHDSSPYLFLSNRKSPISRIMLHVLMKKYCALSGIAIDKSCFKALRHSIATHMVDAEAPIQYIQNWLGHKSWQSTQVYAQMRDETFRKIYNRVSLQVV